MAEIEQSVIIGFAQKIAGNEKKFRDRAVKKLKKWIISKSQANENFDLEELLKLWKGLHYCMWMADKPLIQEELSHTLASLIHSFHSPVTGVRFFEAALITQAREWDKLDKYRLDKFMMFVRHILHEGLTLCRKSSWSVQDELTAAFSRTVCGAEAETGADGIKYHVADIYLDELEKVAAESELSAEQVVKFFQPYNEMLIKLKNSLLAKYIVDNVYLAAANRMIERKESKEQKEAQQEDDEEEDMEVEEEQGPVLEYDIAAIADSLFQAASSDKTARNRKLAYSTATKLQSMASPNYERPAAPNNDIPKGVDDEDIESAVDRLVKLETKLASLNHSQKQKLGAKNKKAVKTAATPQKTISSKVSKKTEATLKKKKEWKKVEAKKQKTEKTVKNNKAKKLPPKGSMGDSAVLSGGFVDSDDEEIPPKKSATSKKPAKNAKSKAQSSSPVSMDTNSNTEGGASKSIATKKKKRKSSETETPIVAEEQTEKTASTKKKRKKNEEEEEVEIWIPSKKYKGPLKGQMEKKIKKSQKSAAFAEFTKSSPPPPAFVKTPNNKMEKSDASVTNSGKKRLSFILSNNKAQSVTGRSTRSSARCHSVTTATTNTSPVTMATTYTSPVTMATTETVETNDISYSSESDTASYSSLTMETSSDIIKSIANYSNETTSKSAPIHKTRTKRNCTVTPAKTAKLVKVVNGNLMHNSLMKSLQLEKNGACQEDMRTRDLNEGDEGGGKGKGRKSSKVKEGRVGSGRGWRVSNGEEGGRGQEVMASEEGESGRGKILGEVVGMGRGKRKKGDEVGLVNGKKKTEELGMKMGTSSQHMVGREKRYLIVEEKVVRGRVELKDEDVGRGKKKGVNSDGVGRGKTKGANSDGVGRGKKKGANSDAVGRGKKKEANEGVGRGNKKVPNGEGVGRGKKKGANSVGVGRGKKKGANGEGVGRGREKEVEREMDLRGEVMLDDGFKSSCTILQRSKCKAPNTEQGMASDNAVMEATEGNKGHRRTTSVVQDRAPVEDFVKVGDSAGIAKDEQQTAVSKSRNTSAWVISSPPNMQQQKLKTIRSQVLNRVEKQLTKIDKVLVSGDERGDERGADEPAVVKEASGKPWIVDCHNGQFNRVVMDVNVTEERSQRVKGQRSQGDRESSSGVTVEAQRSPMAHGIGERLNGGLDEGQRSESAMLEGQISIIEEMSRDTKVKSGKSLGVRTKDKRLLSAERDERSPGAKGKGQGLKSPKGVRSQQGQRIKQRRLSDESIQSLHITSPRRVREKMLARIQNMQQKIDDVIEPATEVTDSRSKVNEAAACSVEAEWSRKLSEVVSHGIIHEREDHCDISRNISRNISQTSVAAVKKALSFSEKNETDEDESESIYKKITQKRTRKDSVQNDKERLDVCKLSKCEVKASRGRRSNSSNVVQTRRSNRRCAPPPPSDDADDSDCVVVEIVHSPDVKQACHVRPHPLGAYDRALLERSGEWLNDIHVNLAQALLKQQFPTCAGLENCGLVRFSSSAAAAASQQNGGIAGYVQILNTRGVHWICVSNMMCDDWTKTTFVYDSSFRTLHEDVRAAIRQIHGGAEPDRTGSDRSTTGSRQRSRSGSDRFDGKERMTRRKSETSAEKCRESKAECDMVTAGNGVCKNKARQWVENSDKERRAGNTQTRNRARKGARASSSSDWESLISSTIANDHHCNGAITNSDTPDTSSLTSKQIGSLMSQEPRYLNAVLVPFQRQAQSDCGLFAIACATSLVHGQDPSCVSYQRTKMRRHLLSCFVEQRMTLFPTLERDTLTKLSQREFKVQLM